MALVCDVSSDFRLVNAAIEVMADAHASIDQSRAQRLLLRGLARVSRLEGLHCGAAMVGWLARREAQQLRTNITSPESRAAWLGESRRSHWHFLWHSLMLSHVGPDLMNGLLQPLEGTVIGELEMALKSGDKGASAPPLLAVGMLYELDAAALASSLGRVPRRREMKERVLRVLGMVETLVQSAITLQKRSPADRHIAAMWRSTREAAVQTYASANVAAGIVVRLFCQLLNALLVQRKSPGDDNDGADTARNANGFISGHSGGSAESLRHTALGILQEAVHVLSQVAQLGPAESLSGRLRPFMAFRKSIGRKVLDLADVLTQADDAQNSDANAAKKRGEGFLGKFGKKSSYDKSDAKKSNERLSSSGKLNGQRQSTERLTKQSTREATGAQAAVIAAWRHFLESHADALEARLVRDRNSNGSSHQLADMGVDPGALADSLKITELLLSN